MNPEDHIFRTARSLPFPPLKVFGAFESPLLLAAWWGPDGFSNSFDLFEFWVGGRWKFVMHGPDGKSYPNENVFVELEPGHKVVVRHDCLPYFTLTVSLAPVPGGMHLTWQQDFDDPKIAQAVQHIVVPANEQNLDRLSRVLMNDGTA